MSLRHPAPPRDVRSEVLRLAIRIFVVHGIAVGVYFIADIASRTTDVQRAFTIAWTVITLALVLTGLRRVRIARDLARRGHSGPAARPPR